MRLYAVALLILCAACAPVSGDPYTQRAAADGAIQATLISNQSTAAAESRQGTQIAAIATAQNDAAMRAVLETQSYQDAQQKALDLRGTQIAQDIVIASATQQARDAAEATKQARIDATSTATVQAAIYSATATRQVQIDAMEDTKSKLAGSAWFVLMAGMLGVVWFLKPVWVALAQNLAQQIRARSLIRETNGGMVMAYVQIGNNAGLFVPSDQVLQYARLMAQTQPYIDAEPQENYADDEDETAPPEYWHVRQLLEATIKHAERRGYAPNQLAAHPVARLGGGQWSNAVEALRIAGVNVVTRNGVGTFIEDKRYQTVEALRDAIFAHEVEIVALPSPTGEMAQIYA